MFEDIKKNWGIRWHKLRHGVYIDIRSPKLKDNVEFILYNLPKPIIKGVEIIEDMFERNAEDHQVIVKETMSAMEIKREIGRYIFQQKRWPEQEAVAKKLLAQEMIDLDTLYFVYETKDYLKIYEYVNADVFAVFYGNDSMRLEEVAHAINMLYVKDYTDKNFSQQNDIDNLVEQLFKEQEKK